MAAHITPLTRNQLLDLESLVNALIATVSEPASPQRCSPCDVMDASHPPLPFPSGAGQHHAASSTDAAATLTTSSAASHPILHGIFVDVFSDPHTTRSWRLHDKILYVVWWSYRPPCCAQCGMQDAWVPSADAEMRCAQCGAEAGSTRTNDVVEDFKASTAERGGGEDDSGGEEDAPHPTEAEDGAADLGHSPLAAYTFFYEWISAVAALHGQTVGLMLPSGEALPTVLRAAYDMSGLLLLPGMTPGAAPVVRATALYLSITLHRYAVPFPLFCLAGQQRRIGAGAPCDEVLELQWVDVEYQASLLGVALADFFEAPQVSTQYLQNVLTVAAEYAVPSVLWHPGRVPGRLELLQAMKQQQSQRQQRHPLHHSQQLQQRGLKKASKSASSTRGMSPEHVAMCVALEFARRLDERPIAAAAASPEAAAATARRVGQWLDSLGLYPSRRVYREAVVRGLDSAASHAALHEWAAQDDADLLAAAHAGGAALTSSTSVFARRFDWILPSPSANALLHVLSSAFRRSPLELAELAARSGIYSGPTNVLALLRDAAVRGDYAMLPLARRLSPVKSCWTSVYATLHSADRLPLLAALHQLSAAQNSTRDRTAALIRLLQRMLRKHGAAHHYQLNYVLRVVDEREKHFNGLYFLSSLLGPEGLATFTCLRSGRKTITFNAHNHMISLCYLSSKERLVTQLEAYFVGPVVAALEGGSTKALMDLVVGGSEGIEPWSAVVRRLDRCGRVRRRMRVPMLASRLDALASIREAEATRGQGTLAATTLAGWGETESVLVAPPPVDVGHLRRELQENLLLLPSAALLLGLSENRVVAMYASLLALLEQVEAGRSRQAAAAGHAPSAQPAEVTRRRSWVEELLSSGSDGDLSASEADEDADDEPYDMDGWAAVTAVPYLALPGDPTRRSAGAPRRYSPPQRATLTPQLTSRPPPPSSVVRQQRQQTRSSHSGTPQRQPHAAREDTNDSATCADRRRQQEQLALERLRQLVPPYPHVLLGVSRSFAAVAAGGGTASGGGPAASVLRRRAGGSHGRPRQQVVDGARGKKSASEAEAAERLGYVFTLRDAEECRRRLHRLMLFLSEYQQVRERLLEQVANETLPPLGNAAAEPSQPTSSRSPQQLHEQRRATAAPRNEEQHSSTSDTDVMASRTPPRDDFAVSPQGRPRSERSPDKRRSGGPAAGSAARSPRRSTPASDTQKYKDGEVPRPRNSVPTPQLQLQSHYPPPYSPDRRSHRRRSTSSSSRSGSECGAPALQLPSSMADAAAALQSSEPTALAAPGRPAIGKRAREPVEAAVDEALLAADTPPEAPLRRRIKYTGRRRRRHAKALQDQSARRGTKLGENEEESDLQSNDGDGGGGGSSISATSDGSVDAGGALDGRGAAPRRRPSAVESHKAAHLSSPRLPGRSSVSSSDDELAGQRGAGQASRQERRPRWPSPRHGPRDPAEPAPRTAAIRRDAKRGHDESDDDTGSSRSKSA